MRKLGLLLHGVGLLPVLLGCVATYFGVFVGFAEQKRGYAEKIERLEGLMRTAKSVRDEHSKLKASMAEVEERAATVRQRIPEQPREAEFLRNVTQIASAEGLNIRDYQRGAVTPQDDHQRLEVRLSCEGEYPSICGFLDQLAGLPRISTINKMEVSANHETGVYPFDLTVVLYFGIVRAADDKGSEADA